MLDKITYKNTITTADYNKLRNSVGWNQIHEKQAQTGINNSMFLIAAEYDGQTIGMSRVVGDGGYIAIIVDVIVLPEFQGKGIGTVLMTKVMEFIKSRLEEGYGINVNLMAAKGREGFYKKFGFIERPDDKFGAGMNVWLKKQE